MLKNGPQIVLETVSANNQFRHYVSKFIERTVCFEISGGSRKFIWGGGEFELRCGSMKYSRVKFFDTFSQFFKDDFEISLT